jgi:chromosome segregation ATPase
MIEEASRTAMSYLDSRHVDYTRGSLTTHLNNQIIRLEYELTQTRIIIMRLNGQIASLESELSQARDVTRDLNDQIANLENELAQARSTAYSANIRFNEQTVRRNDKLAHALHVGSSFRARFEDADKTVRELREELKRQQAAAASRQKMRRCN